MAVPNDQPLPPREISQRPQFKVLRPGVLKFLLLALLLVVGCSLVNFSMSRFLGIEGRLGPLPCLNDPVSLTFWIRPQWSLMHEMTDEELFWRASLVPQVKNYPFERVPKIAFMFLAVGPLPLYPLWEKFFDGHERFYSIYIHSLPAYRANFPRSSPFHGRQIPSQTTQWGETSICDAERRLLANALLDFHNEWFVLVSESCIPLVNFSLVHGYFKRANQSFIQAFDDPGVDSRGRYNPLMAPEINISDWRKGSQWFEVERAAAVAILKDTTFYPKFKEYCKPRCYVDEHYLPTMLTLEMPTRLAYRSVTWVDWSRGGAHPATFGHSDITEEFLRGIVEGHRCDYNGENSDLCFLFARKFSPSGLFPLLELAPKVLSFG